ncbi:hypothetical protein [Paenibacillus humicus]|uniref:hypothetical protein n=1 Tax=Paenibacillus humicus TaxID=412861 RepID=UPI000FD96115|nr:hypothetical protein [Paenibacillus humicus]
MKKDLTLFFISPHNWHDHVSKNQINRPLKLAEQFSKDQMFKEIYIVNRIRPQVLYFTKHNRLEVGKSLGFKILRCNDFANTYYVEHCFPFGKAEEIMLPMIIKRIKRKKKIKDSIILVSDPKSASIFQAKLGLGIFDAYDNWELSPLYKDDKRNREAISSGYKIASKYAEVLITNTPYMMQSMLRNEGHVYLVGNTSSLSSDKIITKKESEYNKKKSVGYIGNIYERLDLNIIDFISDKFLDVDFIFIGKQTWGNQLDKEKFLQLTKKNNVFYNDKIPYDQITNKILDFDVCIIPHIVDVFTLTQDSMKMYDFLSLGKPIVTTPVPPSELLMDYVYIADDKERFAEKLQNALDEVGQENKQSRQEYMKQNGWASRTNEIYSIIKDVSLA